MAKQTIKDIWNKKQQCFYVYNQTCYWDSQKKQARYKRKLIGKRKTKNDVISYNAQYRLMKLLKEKQQDTEAQTPTVIKDHQQKDTKALIDLHDDSLVLTSLGPKLIFEKYIHSYKLRTFLVKAMGKEDAELILAIALANICTNQAYSWSYSWLEFHGFNQYKSITSQRISELCERIDENKIIAFLRLWLRAHACTKGYFCWDSTNIKSQCNNDYQVQKGYTHQHEQIPQKNLAVLSSQNYNVPVWYELYEGATNDCNTITDLSNILHQIITTPLCFVLDRGYFSDTNFHQITSQSDKFLIPIPNSSSLKDKYIQKNKEKIKLSTSQLKVYDSKGKVKYLQGCTSTFVKEHHRYWVRVYFNTREKAKSDNNFNILMGTLREELKTQKLKSQNKKLYDQFFTYHKTTKHKMSVKDNIKEQEAYKNRYSGYWCLYTNAEKNAAKAYEVYANRNTAERMFDVYKNEIDGRTERSHSNKTHEGRSFILFIELILLNLFKNDLEKHQHALKEAKVKNYHEIINRMESLVACYSSLSGDVVYKNPNKFQRIILKVLDLTWG